MPTIYFTPATRGLYGLTLHHKRLVELYAYKLALDPQGSLVSTLGYSPDLAPSELDGENCEDEKHQRRQDVEVGRGYTCLDCPDNGSQAGSNVAIHTALFN